MTGEQGFSKPPGGEQAVASLRGLLELSRLIRARPPIEEVLRTVASTVSEAIGFATSVVNLYHPESDQYEVVAVHGSDAAYRELFGQMAGGDTWQPLLDSRFRRHGVYFIPEGEFDYDDSVRWHVPEIGDPAALTAADWHADDALFATLDGYGGRRYGILSVDDPVTRRRPDEQQLEMLGVLAALAALALESSMQMAALEASLNRNRAVINSALDCLIAVDLQDRVVDFNPAAERTFGMRSDEVLGGDAATLFVPPDGRDAYRQGAQRIRDNPQSGLLGRRIETNAMRSGGEVFPIELTITRVEGAEEGPMFYAFVRDISERRRVEEQLAYLAYHDALTGLPNRILVEQQLDLALARARRAKTSVALMFVDLDDFKEVNDRLGHAAGDRLLPAVATRLRGVLRDSDVLARQGGDEFLVLLADLADAAEATAERVGDKLLEALREPFVVANTEILTSASIGVSVYPEDAPDTESLLRHADAAMYVAKASGGARVAFHRGPPAPTSRLTGLAGQLRAAISNGELQLHYQPIRRLDRSQDIVGVEALLRWRHPEQGVLEAHRFMRGAEQSTLAEPLMAWVVDESCRQARLWRDSGLDPLIFLNASPTQLLAGQFVVALTDRISRTDLDPRRFVIELTESEAVESDDVTDVIDDLRACGVSLLLDDFGAGRSSLSRMRGLTFDGIKIDGRLLAGVPADPVAVQLLEAIIGLTASGQVESIAEGVENQAQIDFLMAHGIKYGQGFGLGRPAPAHEATASLRSALVAQPAPRRRNGF